MDHHLRGVFAPERRKIRADLRHATKFLAAAHLPVIPIFLNPGRAARTVPGGERLHFCPGLG